MHEWFKTYYGPNNAVLVIAGDIDAKTALEKVKQYFGDIPPGPPIARHEAWIAKTHRRPPRVRPGPRAAGPRLPVWNVPEWGTERRRLLDLASSVLADGKTSRLYKRLVYDDQIATDVNAYVDMREIAGSSRSRPTPSRASSWPRSRRPSTRSWPKFLTGGPTADELERVKTQYRARFIRGIERIGGFGGKSDILATSQVFGGTPDSYKTTLDSGSTKPPPEREGDRRRAGSPTASTSSRSSRTRSSRPRRATSTASHAGRRPGAAGQLPALERATLSNGLKIMLAERHAIPVVDLSLLVDAGYAADQVGLAGHGPPGHEHAR